MAGALKKRLGLTIESDKPEGQDRGYRITAGLETANALSLEPQGWSFLFKKASDSSCPPALKWAILIMSLNEVSLLTIETGENLGTNTDRDFQSVANVFSR